MTSGIAPTGDAAKRVAAVLTAGGVALIPTDTVYGLVADPDNAAAVDRIYEIKGRPESQPIAVLVGPEFPLDRVAYEVPAAVRRVAKPFWASGRLTIVLRRRPGHMDAICGRRANGWPPVARPLVHATGDSQLRPADSGHERQYLRTTESRRVRGGRAGRSRSRGLGRRRRQVSN